MHSINLKLIVSNIAIVLVSVLLIAIPVINIEKSQQQSNMNKTAELEVNNVYSSINNFLTKPQSIVESFVAYVDNNKINRSICEEMFNDAIKDDENFYVLYHANNVPVKDGGYMYSSDGWEPPADYDQVSQYWFQLGINAKQTVVSEPYVDEESGSIITTIIHPTKNNEGIVALDIMLDTILGIIEKVKLTPSGVSYLLSESGLYIANGDNSKILNTNFFDEYPQFNQYKKQISENSSFFTIDKASKMYFAGRIISEGSGWVFVTTGPVSEFYKQVRKNFVMILLVSILSVLIGLVIAFFVARRMVTPIKIVDSTVNEIASGKADLTRHIEVKSKDEIGSLVNGFNKFVDKLKTIVREIKASKEDLISVDSKLQDSITNATDSVEKIIGNINKIGREVDGQSQAVTQTSAAVAEIAENINSLERMIENQSGGVSDASSAVEQMIGNISSVNSSVEKMASSFEKLQESASVGINRQHSVSQEIADIANESKSLQDANKAIQSVASQTNLLAMNAAIEAAHAGEAGRGFSVVADEIRKLSETSTEQSKKIGAELQKISEKIASVVNASNSSSEDFDQINEMIKSTDELVRQIKAAMEEQQEGSKQIVTALKTMNDSTSEVKVASHEMAEGNQLILKEVQNLQETTFHIRDSMNEMTDSAIEMKTTSKKLSEISNNVEQSVDKIGEEIDEFNA